MSRESRFVPNLGDPDFFSNSHFSAHPRLGTILVITEEGLTDSIREVKMKILVKMSAGAQSTMQRIRRKSWVALSIIRLYRNWPMAVLDRLYLVDPQSIVYRLRGGVNLSVRTRDAGIINEIWIDRAYTSLPGFAIL